MNVTLEPKIVDRIKNLDAKEQKQEPHRHAVHLRKSAANKGDSAASERGPFWVKWPANGGLCTPSMSAEPVPPKFEGLPHENAHKSRQSSLAWRRNKAHARTKHLVHAARSHASKMEAHLMTPGSIMCSFARRAK